MMASAKKATATASMIASHIWVLHCQPPEAHLPSHGSLKSRASPIFALRNHLRRRSRPGKFAAAISAPTMSNASVSM
jgi:hypothetical protein